jgi:hypothetical protein
MNSKSDSLKVLPTSSTSHSNHITRANTFVIKAFDIEQNLNKFVSNSQSSFLSKTINPQSTIQHRPRLQWLQRRSSFQTNSLTDFKLTDTNNIKKNIVMNPSISITDMTAKDFNNEFQTDLDQTLRYTTIAVVTSEDDDDTDQEILSSRKVFVDQASQAVLPEPQPKKKTTSNQPKKPKSSPRRSKQTTNVSQNPPSTVSSVSSTTNSLSPNNDSSIIPTSVKPSTSTAKNEEVKSIITVDTSKARSNLEVVRLCLRELGWKEVKFLINTFNFVFYCIYSVHIIQHLILIFIGIHLPFMKVIHHLPTLLVELINFLVCSEYYQNFLNIIIHFRSIGMNDLLRKIHLTRSLNNMRLLFPNEYNFYPKTWFLPEQNQQFKDDVRYIHQLDKKYNQLLTTFIVKPSGLILKILSKK